MALSAKRWAYSDKPEVFEPVRDLLHRDPLPTDLPRPNRDFSTRAIENVKKRFREAPSSVQIQRSPFSPNNCCRNAVNNEVDSSESATQGLYPVNRRRVRK